MGAAPEADVRISKDGVLVAFHDKDLSRIVPAAPPELKKKGVEALTWEELRRLDVGSFRGPQFAGESMARMSDVFAHMQTHPEHRIYLDSKLVKDVGELAALVHQYDVDHQVILASRFPDELRRWKEMAPDSETLLWIGGSEAKIAGRLEEVRKTGYQGLTQIQIHVKIGSLDSPDPFTPSSTFLRGVAKELRSRRILFQVLPLTSAGSGSYVELMKLGVESFATDYPEPTFGAIRQYYSEKGKATSLPPTSLRVPCLDNIGCQ